MEKELFWDYGISSDLVKKAEDTETLICESGEATICVDVREYRLGRNGMCVVFGGDIYRIRDASPDFRCRVYAINEDFIYNVNIPSFTRTYVFIRRYRHLSLTPSEREDFEQMYSSMKRRYIHSEGTYRREIAQHQVTALIYDVMEIYAKRGRLSEETFTRTDMIYFDFIAMAEKECYVQRGTAYYADRLCISPRYLSQICKDITGLTAKQCIDDLVIVSSKVLLRETTLSVSQISDRMNFPSTSFFVRFFRRNTGMTPMQYRKDGNPLE